MEMPNDDLIKKGLQCPYCGKDSKCVHSSAIYGWTSDYGFMYWCQSCDAYVGCHKNTKQALGRLANKQLRKLKQQAHDAFDPLWKHLQSIGYKEEARSLMYIWLSVLMGLDINDTHIGMFNEDQCEDVIYLCNKFNPFK